MNKCLQTFARLFLRKEVYKQFIHTWIAAECRATVPRQFNLPVLCAIVVVKGTGERTCDKVRILGAVVVVLIRPCHCEERGPVNADRLSVNDGHMIRAVARHKACELCLAPLRRGVIREIILRQILLLRILILREILCHIGQIVAHAGHRRRTAAWVEPRARHDVKAALVRLVLRGESHILRDGVPHESIQLIPVHQTEIHVEKAHPVELRRCLRVVVRTVLAQPVRHLVPEHGGEFVHVAAETANEPPIDRHVVRRVAGSVEDRAVRHRPCKGERVHAQHIVTVPHEPLHNAVHERDVIRVARVSVLRNVLSLTLHLCVHIVAESEHRTECGVIRTEHTECLRRNPPRVDRLRTRRRKECRRHNYENRKHCCRCFSHRSPHTSANHGFSIAVLS